MPDHRNQPRHYQHHDDYRQPAAQPGYGPRGDYGPPPPPKKSKAPMFLIGGAVLVALIIIGAALGGGKNNSSDTTTATSTAAASAPAASVAAKATKAASGLSGYGQHPEDIKVTSCTAGDFGTLTAGLSVTNHSSKASTYAITVSFESADHKTQYGEGADFVSSLAPGQVGNSQALGSGTPPPGSALMCRLTQAQRTAA